MHRGEYEVETIAGEHHVRIYTAVVNPAPLDISVPGKQNLKYKDIQQNPNTGALSITPGNNSQLWAGAGRPQRAVQWLAKYEITDGGKKVSDQSAEVKNPVLRSFLVPLDVYNRITSGSTIEGAPGSSPETDTFNVDQRGEPNQFGIGGPHLDALIQHATPGSLVTYSSPQHNSFAHPDGAGRVTPVAKLYERLGIDPDFKPDALGNDYNPWFSWETNKKTGKLELGFSNNPQRLHEIATTLREHHVTWKQAAQNPADRKPEALIEPDSESAPGKKDDAQSRDTSFAARFERLNQFLNSVGPPSVNVGKIATDVLSTAPGVLNTKLATTTVPDVDPNTLADVVNTQVVPKSLDTVMRDLDLAIKNANGGQVPKDLRSFKDAVENGFGKPPKKAKSFDEHVVDTLVAAFVKDVPKQSGVQLLTDDSRAAVAKDLEVRVRDALQAEFRNLDSLTAEGGRGKKSSWLSGPRLAEFKGRVEQRILSGPMPNIQAEVDPNRFGEVAQQKVLGPVVNGALGSFTGQDLINTSPDDLKAVVETAVLPKLSADIETNLRQHPALALVDPALRDSIAHDVAAEAIAKAKQELGGFTFQPVNPADVDAFMAEVPGVAAQAEIGALIAADSDRIARDFNTRPQDDPRGPFRNEYDVWSTNAEAEYQAQREFGDKLSETIEGVRGADGKPDPKPVVDELIKKFPELAPKFDEVATKPQDTPYRPQGAKDSFTFYEHAQMVLGQYLDLTKAENPDTRFISTDAMAKAILFHDIEKNNAKNQFGDGKGRHDAEPEHKLAVQMMDRYQGLWADQREFDAVKSIVDSDPFGFYLRNKLSADETFKFIHDLAERIGDPDPTHSGPPNPDNARKLFDEFHQYYQADFSSYTTYSSYTDAGGKEKHGPNAFTKSFEPGTDGITRTEDGRHFQYADPQKMDDLRAMFADPDTITAHRDRIREVDARNQAADLGAPPPATSWLADPSRPGTPEPAQPGTQDPATSWLADPSRASSPTSWLDDPSRPTTPAPNAPTTRRGPNGSPTPPTPPAPPTRPNERLTRGPAPELSLDIPPASVPSPEQSARIDALAADLAESNAMRDRNGYRPAVVEVSGPNAQVVADALAAKGIDATVRDTNGTTTDVHVDHDLRRPEGWTPPAAPQGVKVTDTVITSPEPQGPHPVLDNPDWRHSTAPTAPWFDTDPNAATSADIRDARANTPVTTTVRGEDGGVLDSTTVGPDGIQMKAWRGPIAYDTRVLDVNGVPVRDFTVKVFLDPDGNATPDQIAEVQTKTRQGVDAFYNNGNRLPSGEQFHVTVEFTDNPADAHGTVAITGPDGRANQLNWPVDSDAAVLGHEIGHFLGLHDEYFETGEVKPIFQHQEGKGRVVDDNGPMTDKFDAPDARVKPRNLWLVENRMHALESFNPPSAPATQDTDVAAPNAPSRHTTPNPVIPLVTVTPAGPPPAVLPGVPLPSFFQSNQALGSVAVNDVRGADQVATAVNGLLPAVNGVAPQGVDRIGKALDDNFESFLGNGRTFQVQVGKNFYDANVTAVLNPVTGPGTASPAKVDSRVDSGATSTTTTSLTTGNDVSLNATASQGMGAYGTVGAKTTLATPVTSNTTTTTALDDREVRGGDSSTKHDVPVTYRVTLTDARGVVIGTTDVHDNGTGVALQVPDDLGNLANTDNTAGVVRPPDAAWGAKVEHLVPEAVTDIDSDQAFRDVAAKLHPSVTKPGADGRTVLRDFLSATNIRDNLHVMLNGWVTSPNLTSPHSAYGSAVQMKATLLDAELVGTHGGTQFRMHDTATTNAGVTATVGSGVEVNAAVGGGVGVPGVPIGAAGITGSASAKTSETSSSGTTSVNRAGMQVGGQTGLYKVTANVEVRTPNGDTVTVPVTAHVRLGLPEANAHGLPVPENTQAKITEPGTENTRFEPPYLAEGLAAGNIRVGEFTAANQVQAQVENALKGLPGFDGFLPEWNRGTDPRADGKNFADVVEMLNNQRKLDAELSPTALKAQMDSLLGPGVQVQLKRQGFATNEFVNVTVRAKLGNANHLGEADARQVRGLSSTAPKLDSSTTTTKGWSAGVEGRGGANVKPGTASLTPTGNAAVKYSSTTANKTTAGPVVNDVALNVGDAKSQVFAHDIEFEVEITTFSRNQSWVKRMTPGSPLLQVPKEKTVVRTVDPKKLLDPNARDNPTILPQISGKVQLWVPDGSALKTPSAEFKPGDPVDGTLPPNTTISSLLKPGTTRPPRHEWLHVEAVANAEALRNGAIELVNASAGADGSLTVPGTEARNQIDMMFSPENLKANLRKMAETGLVTDSLRFDRRVTDRTGAIGMTVKFDKPKLVSISDTTPVETWTTGGFKAGESVAHGQSVEGSAGFALGGKPNDTTPQGGGTFNAGAKWTPWSKTETTAREVGGNVDRKLVRPSGERTVLVQLHAEFSMVGESRSGNAIYKGTPHANGKTVTLPGGVFVRVSEQVARDMGLLEDVPPHTSPDHGSMRPPKRLNPGEPGGLGLSVVDDVPDLSPVVAQLTTVVNQNTRGKLVPDSVLDDSMRNLQRLVDLTSPTSVKGLIDSAVDGGVPLLLHKPGTVIGKDTYQVTLRAKVGQPKFLEAVNDGRDMEHILAGSNKDSDALTKGSSWGVNARAGGQHLPDVQNGQSPAVGGAIGAGLNFSQSKTTTDTTTELFGHKHTATGPAVRYEVPVEFELVVHKGGKEVGRVKADEAPITVRLHADNVRVDSPDVPDNRRPYEADATSRPKDEATQAKIDEWLRDGTEVPSGASVEGMRGIQDIRMAAIAALERAGAGKGITGKGTGSHNALLSTLSSETLQSMLPGMTKTPLEVPGLHEATLGKAQHASLKVYAKVVDTRLDSLSDGVKLENPTSTTHTTASEAKHTQSGDVIIAPTGGVNKKTDDAQGNPDLVNSANSAFAFPEFKHTSDDSTADSGGPVTGTQQNLKPSERTGLTESTIVYRFVADLGNGKVGVYDLTVPGSADLRMPVADVEATLGRTVTPELATAQDGVRDAAKAWRTAEAAVEVARHQAQDLLAQRAGADIEITNRQTVLDTRSQEVVTAFDALGPHDTAVDNPRTARDTADTALEDATTRAVDLDLASRRADKALGDAAEDVRTTREGVELAEIQAAAVDDARARADQALLDAEAALGRYDQANPPSTDPNAAPDRVREGLVRDVKDATEVRDNRQALQERAARDLADARQEHQAALDRQRAAADAAADAKTAADQAKTDLDAAERAAVDARSDLDAANDRLREARANARQAEQARQTAEQEYQQAVRDRADLETRIADAQADLAREQDVADGRQADWWNAKTAADRQLAAFNAPPTTAPPANAPATTATSSTNAPPPGPGVTAPVPSSPSPAPPGVQTFGAPAATATSTFGAPTASGTPTASTSTPSTSTTPSTTAQRDADAAALASRHQAERTAESNALAARLAAEKQAASLALQAKQQAEHQAEGVALATKLDAERLKAEADLLARQQQDRTNESNAFAARAQAERNRVAAELTANQQAHRQRVAAQVLANQELERNQVEAQIQQQLAVAPGSFDPNQVRQQVLNNQAAVQRNVEQQLDNEQTAERQRVEQGVLAREENDRRAAEHQLNQRQLAERQQAAQQLQLKQDAERAKAEQDLKARQLLERQQAEAALDAKQEAERKAYEAQLNARQDAEHAAELAKWLPSGTRHFAAFADDNAAATWANTAYPGLATVNRTNFESGVPGHDVNCTNCVIATHETLHGRPVAAPPLPAPAPGTYLENTFKSTFQTVGSYHEVVDYLAAQPGRHVSVGITRADGTGHVFNAWNDGGDITFFDSQNQRPAKLEREAVKIEFIPLPDLPKPAPPPTTATAPPATAPPATATPPTGPVP
ncbi:hypothetical protein A6A25_00785 [Saccharothrix sp. CB00851]|nr:hypothetical protein A6A25_00785 [Saccharothrix sp. CB00851]